MSDITRLIKIRYIKPLEALREDVIEKAFLSVLAYVVSVFGNLLSSIEGMFHTPLELILLLLVAVVADWITGVRAAKKNGVYLRSLGFRQTWVKIIEYTAGLLILAGIANVFGNNTIEGWVGELLRFLNNIHWLGFFYATFTEFKSITENLSGKDGRFKEIIDRINDHFFGGKKPDEVR